MKRRLKVIPACAILATICCGAVKALPGRPGRQGEPHKTPNATDAKQVDQEIARLQAEIEKTREKIVKLRRSRPTETVQDYVFKGPGGKDVRLSELFGQKQDLLVVHNMGKRCNYCTLWADGFNGVAQHLENRTAFVLISHDEPAVQQEFAASRHWTFPLVSAKGTTFSKDMGLSLKDGSAYPGVSGFHKDADGKIVRVSKDFLGPGDFYCSVWHLMDLLDGGPKGWEPKLKY
jgi:predicted dithiol-disulfide oxidoreductase (DUF899 family)